MTKKIYPSDKQEQFMVRFPDGMRDRIKRAAEINGRSMNAEIISALEEAYPPEHTSIGEFFTLWVTPIANAESPEEKLRLVNEANEAATTTGWPFSVKMKLDEDGKEIISIYPSASPDDSQGDK